MGKVITPLIRSAKILRHAKGQPCTARFEGECNGDWSTTVWCHLNGYGFGKGMALKSHDVFGFFGCAGCHASYDQGKNRTGREADILRAVCETWLVLIRDGIVFVPLDKPKAPKPIKRKPKGKRTPVRQGNGFKRPPSNTIDINADRTEATE